MFTVAVADALAGYVSDWTTLPTATNNPILTSTTYAHVFGWVSGVAVIAGIGVWLLASQINKMLNR